MKRSSKACANDKQSDRAATAAGATEKSYKRNENDAVKGTKLEFCRKIPLPAIEKDSSFANSVLCTGTFLIRDRPIPIREIPRVINGPRNRGTAGNHRKKVLLPQTHLVPIQGRRSPLGVAELAVQPTIQHGPCGDPPIRAPAQGTGTSVKKSPWVVGTVAGQLPAVDSVYNNNYLPAGLVNVKVNDTCHQHGHRVNNDSRLPKQRAEVFRKCDIRHRAAYAKEADSHMRKSGFGKNARGQRTENSTSFIGDALDQGNSVNAVSAGGQADGNRVDCETTQETNDDIRRTRSTPELFVSLQSQCNLNCSTNDCLEIAVGQEGVAEHAPEPDSPDTQNLLMTRSRESCISEEDDVCQEISSAARRDVVKSRSASFCEVSRQRSVGNRPRSFTGGSLLREDLRQIIQSPPPQHADELKEPTKLRLEQTNIELQTGSKFVGDRECDPPQDDEYGAVTGKRFDPPEDQVICNEDDKANVASPDSTSFSKCGQIETVTSGDEPGMCRSVDESSSTSFSKEGHKSCEPKVIFEVPTTARISPEGVSLHTTDHHVTPLPESRTGSLKPSDDLGDVSASELVATGERESPAARQNDQSEVFTNTSSLEDQVSPPESAPLPFSANRPVPVLKGIHVPSTLPDDNSVTAAAVESSSRLPEKQADEKHADAQETIAIGSSSEGVDSRLAGIHSPEQQLKCERGPMDVSEERAIEVQSPTYEDNSPDGRIPPSLLQNNLNVNICQAEISRTDGADELNTPSPSDQPPVRVWPDHQDIIPPPPLHATGARAVCEMSPTANGTGNKEVNLSSEEIVQRARRKSDRLRYFTNDAIYPIREDEEDTEVRLAADRRVVACGQDESVGLQGGQGEVGLLENDDTSSSIVWNPIIDHIPTPLLRKHYLAARDTTDGSHHGECGGGGGGGGGGATDRRPKPANYMELTATMEDMLNRFYTDVTPLDRALSAINVVNSCTSSIGHHSYAARLRVTAALESIKRDDVYKHALVCPLARQCAATTDEFSQSLYRVFRRFANRFRAVQEALLDYYKALASGEIMSSSSPEVIKQIRRDGRKLYMSWDGRQYVSRFYTDSECSSSANSESDEVITVETNQD